MQSGRGHRAARLIIAGLLLALLIPAAAYTLRAAQQFFTLAPGDQAVVRCETSLTGRVQGGEATLVCATAAPAAPTAAPSAVPSAAPPALLRELRGVSEGQALRGAVTVEALVADPAAIAQVVFRLDGPQVVQHTERVAPYFFMGDTNGVASGFNSAIVPDGAYTLTVTATGRSGQSESRRVALTIANQQAAQPTRAPAAPQSPPTSVPTSVPTSAPTSAPTNVPQPTAAPPQASGVRPISYWEQKLLAEAWREDAYSPKLCATMSEAPQVNRNLYHLGNCIDGYTAMYEATGNTQYLDRAMKYVTTVIAKATPAADGYLDWSAYSLDQGHTWRHVTRLLRVIRQTPALYDAPAYRGFYQTTLAFSEKHVFQKWYTRDAKNHIYRGRTHIASHWAMIAMNLSLISTDQQWSARYKEVYTKINSDLTPYYGSSLRAKMEPHPAVPEAYVFHDQWMVPFQPVGQRTSEQFDPDGYHPVSDTHHGQDTVGYIVESERLGLFWTRRDLAALSVTLKKLTWNGSYTPVRFAMYIDGSGGFDSPGAQCLEEGMLKLGRYDAEVQRLFEAHTPKGCYPIQYYGNMALNARLLAQGSR